MVTLVTFFRCTVINIRIQIVVTGKVVYSLEMLENLSTNDPTFLGLLPSQILLPDSDQYLVFVIGAVLCLFFACLITSLTALWN